MHRASVTILFETKSLTEWIWSSANMSLSKCSSFPLFTDSYAKLISRTIISICLGKLDFLGFVPLTKNRSSFWKDKNRIQYPNFHCFIQTICSKSGKYDRYRCLDDWVGKVQSFPEVDDLVFCSLQLRTPCVNPNHYDYHGD